MISKSNKLISLPGLIGRPCIEGITLATKSKNVKGMDAILDTGSNNNYISKSLTNQLGAVPKTPKKESKRSGILGFKTDLYIDVDMIFRLSAEKMIKKMRFLYIEELEAGYPIFRRAVILGTPFFKDMDFCLSYFHETLTVETVR